MVFRFEQKFLNWFRKNFFFIAFAILVALSILIRIFCFDFVSVDMTTFLLPWVGQFKEQGILGLRDGVGDYNIPYLLLVYLAAKLPIDPMYSIKLFSVIADYFFAAGIAMIVYYLRRKDDDKNRVKWALVSFLVIIFMSTAVINSAVWGQCDSVYGAFAVWSVYFIMRNKVLLSFILFAISFAFKLQAIFLLPFFIIVYVVNRKFTCLWFLTVPIVLLISAIPSMVMGGSIFFGFSVYLEQTSTYAGTFLNYPNITVFLREIDSELFSTALIFFTMAFFVALLAWLLVKNAEIKGDTFILLAAVSVLGAVQFLPTMHERYGYIGELLLWAWFFAKPSLKRFVPTVIINTIATISYMPFIFAMWPFSPNVVSLINLGALFYLIWRLVCDVPIRQNLIESSANLTIENYT